MSEAWTAVLASVPARSCSSRSGRSASPHRRLPQRVDQLLELIAPAILAALVVTETFASGRSLVLDARLAGVAAGIVAVAAPRAALGRRRRRRRGDCARAARQLKRASSSSGGRSASDSTTRSASSSPKSRVTLFGIATTKMPAARAALTPFGESSKTTASDGRDAEHVERLEVHRRVRLRALLGRGRR